MRDINVGLIGFGTIGAGVAKALLRNKAILEERLGFSLVSLDVAEQG
jgi:homoserine dehydrogenase